MIETREVNLISTIFNCCSAGFTALAVDGGMVFADRRSAQNAADAAALAGALQKSNGRSDMDVRLAVESSLRSNGFDPADMILDITNFSDFSGYFHLVTVELNFSARSNSSDIDVRGNGDIRITGLVYAINGEFLAKGGGSSVDEWVVNGQLISRAARGDGNGSFVVTYNQNATYWLPPQLSLER
jgi:hypothetical protein